MLLAGAAWAQQLAVEEAVAPVYPEAAVKGRAIGSVIVKAQVSERGTVTGASVEEGDTQLRQVSLAAARLWKFAAQAGSHEVRLIFSFRLMPQGTADAELGAVFRPPYTVEVRRLSPDPVSHVARR